MNKTKIVVCGAAGRMGSSIVRLAGQDDVLEIAGGVESAGHSAVGGKLTATSLIYDDLSKVADKADVIIDFTSVQSSLKNTAVAEQKRKAIVIGTTGISHKERDVIKKASEKIPVVLSSNMSVGVNILFRLVKEVAALLPGYDVEVLELHHNQKKDAPSGTAVTLAKNIADTLNRDMNSVGVYGRHGIVGARKKEEIGVHAVRAGDIVGEHTVYFAGPGERIELTHRAHTRDMFAAGALIAAKWLAGRKPGLYDMQDVLNLKGN